MLAVAIFVAALGITYLVGVEDRRKLERRGKWERLVSIFQHGLGRAVPMTAIKIVVVSWQIITQVNVCTKLTARTMATGHRQWCVQLIRIDIFLSPTESTVFVLIPRLRASRGQSHLPCSMAQFSGVVNVEYPTAYKKFLAALSVVNLNLGYILSLSCVVETNFYARLILVTIAPVAVLGALAITYRVAVLRNGHSDKTIARNKHLSVGLFLLFVVYSSVSYTIFQTFVCDSLDSGVAYLRADYDLVCGTRTHVGFMTYAGFMVLVYPVGIPAVFAWALFKNRDSIKV